MSDNLFQTRSQFNATIENINDELGQDMLIDIIFLSREFYSGDCNIFLEPKDVFQKLNEMGYITVQQPGLLTEIIWRIGRKDLVKKYLVSNVKVYAEQLQQRSRFSNYRLMLHELCQQMVDRSLKLMTLNLNISEHDVSRITTPQHMFIFMENHGLLSPQDETKLIEWITATKDEYLYGVLEKYGKIASKIKRTRQFVHASPPLHSNAVSAIQQPVDESDGPLKCYPMKANPRGLCVIFSNTKNKGAYGAKCMDKGEDLNVAALRDTWKKLGFIVQTRTDQSTAQMEEIMKGIGTKEDHTYYDAFVCCILSHGNDGGSLTIEKLVNNVKPNQCESLKGKPKLFFVVQGCEQQEDNSDDDIETDSPSLKAESPYVPNEADILISYATESSGSFYVQSLCKYLKPGTNHSLMEILTCVNRDVKESGSGTLPPKPESTLINIVRF